MPLRNYFDFLSRGEKGILNEITANLDLAIDSSRHLLVLVRALKAHEFERVSKEIEEISNLESQADEAHLRVVERICSGSFFGGIGEDLLALLEQIDNIADNAKDSARIFSHRKISDDAIDYLFKEDVVGFVETCLETAQLFRQAVEALSKSKQDVLKTSSDVERHEEKADAIRSAILGNLLKNEINADALDVVMLKDFLNTADNIADSAEDGSDVLLILVAKGYT